MKKPVLWGVIAVLLASAAGAYLYFQKSEETKTAAPWPVEVSMKFGAAAAAAGINLREKPISHFNSVTAAFRAVVDMPRDMHLNLVAINGAKAS